MNFTAAQLAARIRRNLARAMTRKVCPICGDRVEVIGGRVVCADPDCNSDLDKALADLDAQACGG